MAVKTQQFPSDTERMRITTLRKFQKLHDNEQMAVLGIHDLIKKHYKNLADLMYLAHAIPARITEFYGDFVQGDVEQLIIQANTGNEADEEFVEQVVYDNDLKERIADYGEDQSQFGFVVFLGWVDEQNKFHIDAVPADQYFPQPDGSAIFATYKKDPDDPEKKKLVLHTQHYQLQDNGDVLIEHQAWYTNNLGVATDPYSLEQMSILVGRDLQPQETIEGLGELPIRQADNGRKSKWGFGVSDYNNIVPQLAEINERTTHASTVFLKNIDAKLVVPASSLDEDEKTGEVKLRQQDVYIAESKEDLIPSYVTNTNPLLEDAREHVNTELKFIEWVTGVPMWALTKGSQAEKVESLRIQLFTALRKSSKKRSKIKRALLDMFRLGAKMTNQSEELQTTDINIDFGDVLPRDEMAIVDAESAKVTSGLTSKKRSMMRIENYTAEEAEEELAEIDSENKIAGIGDEGNAPTL